MEIKYFNPIDLKDYENNAKLHPDSQIRLIIRNIESAGFYNPILISPDKTIIAGHGRRKAALQAGLSEVPCIVLDVDKTTANKLRLMDNKSAESGYDLEKLVDELKTFSMSEIEDTGYSQDDLDRMLDDLGRISVIPSQGMGRGYDFGDEDDDNQDEEADYSIKEEDVNVKSWEETIGQLPSGDKQPFTQKTFTLHDSQSETVDNALFLAKKDSKIGLITENDNSNGNALFLICSFYMEHYGER